MKKKREAVKAELDQQTSYLTLLPAMDEGFHEGYQPVAGIIGDQNQKPAEWLESVAQNMLAQGEDVGYAIPDVLAGEQQMRRLLRMPENAHAQELTDWRAVLALLLLWDSWEKDEAWPALRCVDALGEADEGFRRTVAAALPPDRKTLMLFVLFAEKDGVADQRPLALLSPRIALTPAADMGDLSALLPARVRWYDREQKKFLDPCACLSEAERARLVQRLRLLQTLSEKRELQSPLFSDEAPLVSALDPFIADLLAPRGAWRDRVERGDREAREQLMVRALAVCGLGVEKRVNAPQTQALRENPLLRELLPEGAPDGLLLETAQTEYLLDGAPFARESDTYLLEPTGGPGEEDALARCRRELTLPMQYSADWNLRVGETLARMRSELAARPGASVAVLALLDWWSRQRLAYREPTDCSLTLREPMEGRPDTLDALLAQWLGLPQTKESVFSDALLLCEGECPFEKEWEGRVQDGLFAAPPIAPWLAALLAEGGDPPRVAALAFAPDESGGVAVSLRLEYRRAEQGISRTGAVTFERVYAPGDQVRLKEAPGVCVWPDVRLRDGLWSAYYLCVHEPGELSVWARRSGEWVQGEPRSAPRRGWQTARLTRHPQALLLRRGATSLGALLLCRPLTQLRRGPAAVIGFDFGSIATSVMMRQEDAIRPAALPRGLLGTPMRAGDMSWLADELLPENALVSTAVYRSVMDLFTDDDARWREPLVDGHIFFAELPQLLRKSQNTLYYDLKWGEEPYARACLRMFLQQAMLMAALSARLAGAPSLSWRVSMPGALPLPRQESYLEQMRALSREVAARTGLPLTADVPPVLYATENQADGLYFRGRNEVNVKGGYLNLDVGGGTADLSLWLGGAPNAALESSLLLGCRQMLYDSLSERHPGEFERDFADAPESVRTDARRLVESLNAAHGGLRDRQRSQLLMDAFFSMHGAQTADMMARARAEGRVSLLESLLLFNFAFLMRMCGELLRRAAAAPDTRALMGQRMDLCVAGNGGQFFKDFDQETRRKLCQLTLGALGDAAPVRELFLRQSADPKLEVAIGLLTEDQPLRSTVMGDDGWAGEAETGDAARRAAFLTSFLSAFALSFPQAAEKLMSRAFEGAGAARRPRLTPSAAIELDAILDNEPPLPPGGELAGYARCFHALKRLWNI